MTARAQYAAMLVLLIVAVLAIPVAVGAALYTGDWRWLLGAVPGAIAIRAVMR